jgi:lipoprotein-anchoring transpeptidase ErfK/SrfK
MGGQFLPRQQASLLKSQVPTTTRLLRVARSTKQTESVAPQVVHDVITSGGSPLSDATREFFEPRFGFNFSQVRVHVDSKAAKSADAVNAVAYTVGRDIVFADGQYAPHSDAGRKLLAHELTHVVQQQHSVSSLPIAMGDQKGLAEEEATRNAGVVGSTLGDQTSTTPAPVLLQMQAPNAGEKSKARQTPSKSKASAIVARIVVDLSRQKCFAYSRDQLLFEYHCVTGREGKKTSLGTHRVIKKYEKYTSKKYGAPMNYALRFTDDFQAIHHSSAGFVGLRSFGKALGMEALGLTLGTHGCVGLSEDDAKELFEHTAEGAIVEVIPSSHD